MGSGASKRRKSKVSRPSQPQLVQVQPFPPTPTQIDTSTPPRVYVLPSSNQIAKTSPLVKLLESRGLHIDPFDRDKLIAGDLIYILDAGLFGNTDWKASLRSINDSGAAVIVLVARTSSLSLHDDIRTCLPGAQIIKTSDLREACFRCLQAAVLHDVEITDDEPKRNANHQFYKPAVELLGDLWDGQWTTVSSVCRRIIEDEQHNKPLLRMLICWDALAAIRALVLDNSNDTARVAALVAAALYLVRVNPLTWEQAIDALDLAASVLDYTDDQDVPLLIQLLQYAVHPLRTNTPVIETATGVLEQIMTEHATTDNIFHCLTMADSFQLKLSEQGLSSCSKYADDPEITSLLNRARNL
eukprot:TRINITY_DN219_c0_g1_i2.p1 TRINITY_DN219_c0_g1~~TRINITY_DN219_c0_g1_i2.p1  ORF type:complete len:357 (+),score=21.47 TRINITY_DN219_c0_g1_i2:65-1135(+)